MKTQREGAAALFAEAEVELKKAEMLEVRDRTGKEVANSATGKLAVFG